MSIQWIISTVEHELCADNNQIKARDIQVLKVLQPALHSSGTRSNSPGGCGCQYAARSNGSAPVRPCRRGKKNNIERKKRQKERAETTREEKKKIRNCHVFILVVLFFDFPVLLRLLVPCFCFFPPLFFFFKQTLLFCSPWVVRLFSEQRPRRGPSGIS